MTTQFQPLPQTPAVVASRWRSAGTAWTMLCATATLAFAVIATGTPVAAENDDMSVQAVVQTQLNALAAQDAGTAFALADPVVRTRFGSAEAFLASVRTQYPMMAHPANVLFMKPQSDGTIALQKVRVTDAEGGTWVVTYLLNRQDDHQWRISGCLVEAGGTQVIA